MAGAFPAAEVEATLQCRAYEQLRGRLMRGGFAPGDRLTIRGAAQALGMGVMPVRAALNRLQSEGALVGIGGQRVLGVPAIDAVAYRELRDIRVELEGLAAERSAEHITPSELAGCAAHCARMQASAEAGDRPGYVAANWDFHLSVYQASRMPALVALIERLWLRVGPHVALMMPDREAMVGSIPEHQAVVAALEARDGGAARAAIAQDIRRSAVALLQVLDSSAEGGVGLRSR